MSAYQDEEQRYIFIRIINTRKKQGFLHYCFEKKSPQKKTLPPVCVHMHFSVALACFFILWLTSDSEILCGKDISAAVCLGFFPFCYYILPTCSFLVHCPSHKSEHALAK